MSSSSRVVVGQENGKFFKVREESVNFLQSKEKLISNNMQSDT